jgi:hypothetical protein
LRGSEPVIDDIERMLPKSFAQNLASRVFGVLAAAAQNPGA